eukprot:gb/GECG01003385.1/.p1 GENE.gb/GECG01003385.1/~~gb/GECG01003385.1/.p1  ORF type:complete len:601 (+),score=35.40 gb/GECG01003385.1/:1-1803(+)
MAASSTSAPSTQACWQETLQELRDIQYMAHRMIGPHGRFFLTQDGSLLAHGIDIVNCPRFQRCTVTTKILMDMARAQQSQCYDGVLLLLYVASSVVICCTSLPFSNSTVFQGLERCRTDIDKAIQQHDHRFGFVNFQLRNSQVLQNWATSDVATGSKPATLSLFEIKFLANMALQSSLCLLDGLSEPDTPSPIEDPLAPSESLRSLRILSCFRTSTCFEHDAQLVKRSVVIDTPVPPLGRWPIAFREDVGEIGLMLCFQCSLLPSEVSDPGLPIRSSSRHYELYDCLVRTLKRQQISVVACQKVIPRLFLEWLLNEGILPLERLSIRHFGAICRISGATPITDWLAFGNDDRTAYSRIVNSVGIFDCVKPLHDQKQWDNIYDECELTVVRGVASLASVSSSRNPALFNAIREAVSQNKRGSPLPVSTAIVPRVFSAGSDTNILDGVYHGFSRRFLALLRDKNSKMVPGNGCFELSCASVLLSGVESNYHRAVCTIVSVVAGVLCRCAWAISGLMLSGTGSAGQQLDGLPEFLASSRSAIDPLQFVSRYGEETSTKPEQDSLVLDPLLTKLSALDAALQSAQTILNVRLVHPNLNRPFDPY